MAGGARAHCALRCRQWQPAGPGGASSNRGLEAGLQIEPPPGAAAPNLTRSHCRSRAAALHTHPSLPCSACRSGSFPSASPCSRCRARSGPWPHTAGASSGPAGRRSKRRAAGHGGRGSQLESPPLKPLCCNISAAACALHACQERRRGQAAVPVLLPLPAQHRRRRSTAGAHACAPPSHPHPRRPPAPADAPPRATLSSPSVDRCSAQQRRKGVLKNSSSRGARMTLCYARHAPAADMRPPSFADA